jgi:type I restriction enzyme S subunit
MSEGWRLVPLSEVLMLNKEYIDAPEPRQYPKLSVKLYGKGVVLDKPADGAKLKMKRHQIASSGQIILSEIWGKKGAIGLVPSGGNGALCTSHFFLFDVRREVIEHRYLQALFTANYLEEQLASGAKGTTGYAAVRPKHLLAAQIPLPPLSEQRRIVARIEELAAKIEEARGLRREAALDTAIVLPRATQMALESGTWPRAQLGAILREGSLNGLGIRPANAPPGMPILRISAGTSRPDAIVDESDYKYLEVSPEDAQKYRLLPGDLLACRFNGNLRYVGRFALYKGYSGKPQGYPDKLIRFRLDQGRALPEYVCLVMNSPATRTIVESFCATTAGNIGISAGSLKTIPLPLPPLPEQQRIVVYLGGLQAKVDAVRRLQAETAVELEALLPSVLDRAFRGEL